MVIEPESSVQPAHVATNGKLPTASEAPHQAPYQSPVSQMSPLAELNCFVAAALPTGDETYVYNHYVSSQPVSLNMCM